MTKFEIADPIPDKAEYEIESISLKNYERIKNVTPQNLLYLLYHKFGAPKTTQKLTNNTNFIYLLKTANPKIYAAIYDYKGKISCAAFVPAELKSNEDSLIEAKQSAARILTDLIDQVIIKPAQIGEFKFFATSGRFEYSGQDLFNELGLGDIP